MANGGRAEQKPDPAPSGMFNSACDRMDDCSDETLDQTSGPANMSESCRSIQSSF